MAPRPRVAGGALATLLTLALLAACGGEDAPTPAPEASSPPVSSFAAPSPSPSLPTLPVQPDVAPMIENLLARRANAVLTGDRAAFAATADSSAGDDDPAAAAQLGYYDNLTQLPLAAYGVELDRRTMVRDESGYWAVVQVTTQLDGFDRVPVTSPRRYRFVERDGAWVIASMRDPAWESANGLRLEPWELVPVQVRQAPGALAVFDEGSVARAGTVLSGLRSGIADVRARVPYDWDGSVVLYALSDPGYLDAFDNLPGGDPQHLDGVAFEVLGGNPPERASTRIALSPVVLALRARDRDRLLRHELTHVALAGLDRDAPLWVSEGVAEWVSVQALAPEDRQVSEDGLDAAAAPGVRMPASRSFNDEDAAAHYALAWWVMEYLVDLYGDQAPFALLDAFRAQPDVAERALVRQLVPFTVDQLARRAARLMLDTYRPEETPSPDVTPSTSAAPSSGSSPTG